jgi:diaminohydroxyphosphoribosylaminopyrimidine deaminase/5-amino-6-(5-phosphoribosylamino)uracil reductase
MDDVTIMQRAIDLAWKGSGYVSPNPMVGAILVKNGRIIGEGFHERFGGPHAEIHAIRNAKESTQGATLYVNLEPCSISEKTPPCTESIIKAGISRVIVAMKDPNPKINGAGISSLQKHGIEVVVGIGEKEARKLNRFFITYITQRRPFVTLKMALTLDGWLAETNGRSKWISNNLSRQWVHEQRSEYDAVMVGVGTVIQDNPSLTTHGHGRDPWRIIIDPDVKTPQNSRVLTSNHDNKTWLICKKNPRKRLPVKTSAILTDDPEKNIEAILTHLASEGIASLWVEGGARTFSYFLQAGSVDEMNIFYAPKFLGTGLSPFHGNRALDQDWPLRLIQVQSFGDDVLHRYTWVE